jgi:hypothetical protein
MIRCIRSSELGRGLAAEIGSCSTSQVGPGRPKERKNVRKLLLASILFASAALYAPAADAPSLAGNWTIHLRVMGNEADQSCTFTQKDKELTGSCRGDRVSGAISGTVDGNKVKWQLKRQSGDESSPLDYSGTISADEKITGTVDVAQYGVSGEFAATKVK